MRFLRVLSFVALFLSAGVSTTASIVDHAFRPFATKTFTSIINAIVVQPDGRYLVGGTFTVANGYSYSGLARFNPDHSIDRGFRSTVTGTVKCLQILSDGKILVCGSIHHTVNNISYEGVARLNPDGSVDQTFLGGTGASGIKTVSVQPDGKIIVGGAFSTISGISRLGVARLNSNGTVDQTFDAHINGWVSAVLALQDGNILIGGEPFTVNGGSIRSLVLVDTNGVLNSSFAPSLSGTVLKIKQFADGKILVGGRFTVSSSSTLMNDLFRLNADCSLDEGFRYAFGIYQGYTYDFDRQADGKLLIGGLFGAFGGGPSKSLFRVTEDGSIDTAFTPMFGTLVNAVGVLPDHEIIVGGSRNEQLGYRNMFYRLDANGSLGPDQPISFGFPALVASLGFLPNGKILIAGDFSEVNGKEHGGIARLNPDGSLDSTFNSTGANDRVFDLAVQPDGKVVIGGKFGIVNGVSKTRVARLNYDGTIDETFQIGSGADNTVSEVGLQSDGKVLIGGVFNNFNNITRKSIARLNSDGTLDTTFDTGSPGLDNSVNEIVVQPDGKILIGGMFLYFNGVRAGQIARLNADGSRDWGFNAGGMGTTGPDNMFRFVHSIALQPDGKILFGGVFEGYNNVPRFNFGRLNSDGTLDFGFRADITSTVAGIRRSPADGSYLITGTISSYDGVPQNYVLRLDQNCVIDTGFNVGSGPNSSVVEPGFEPDGDIILGGIFTVVDGQDHIGIARIDVPGEPLYRPVPFDFDGDRRSDLSIYRPSTGQWWIDQSLNGVVAHTFGNATDRIVPADFTGDGKTDAAVWRPATGEWFVLRSEDFTYFSFPFGFAGDVPITGDFDGDTRTDFGVFRPSSSTWYVLRSDGITITDQFGTPGDIPVPADYDGDGVSDLAIYRPSVGQWWVNRSIAGVVAETFGTVNDKPVPADYTGDGQVDIAVWRESTGEWFVLRSDDLTYFSFPFGMTGDVPAPGDYDGDGKSDASIFRPAISTWFVNQSNAGTLIKRFGQAGDSPVPSAYIP